MWATGMPSRITMAHQFVGSWRHAGSDVLSYGRTHVESASGRFRRLVGSNGVSILTAGDDARAPAKVGSRDGKVARDPDLCIGMSAGMMRVATMVEARSNAPRADRPHHLHGRVGARSRSFPQAIILMKTDVDV